MKYKKYSFRNAEVIFENDEKYKEDYSQILNVFLVSLIKHVANKMIPAKIILIVVSHIVFK